MAETSARNEAFLKQMERQRLSKPCIRTIDLRGKVPGECQTYEFGGKRHYLDDRAYLLVKQLLQRFDGRYTIGVYEGLQKALKKLADTDSESSSQTSAQPILYRDKHHVQMMRFDQEVTRKEPRLTIVTPLIITVNDVLYHGATIDITTSALRVSLKRAFTLNAGTDINVNLTEIAEKSGIAAFHNVSYKVLKANHDELRSQLVLIRNRHSNAEVTQWLDNWIMRKQSPEHIDLNNELFNLSTEIYKRLFVESISKPLLWLTPAADIFTLHLSASAAKHLNAIQNSDASYDFSKLLLSHIPNDTSSFLLGLHESGFKLAKIDDHKAIKALFLWKQLQQEGHLLLLHQSDRLMHDKDLSSFSEELEALKSYNPEYAKRFQHAILSRCRMFRVTDISESVRFIPSNDIAPATLNAFLATNTSPVPIPSTIRHYIKRSVERYAIKTDVKLSIQNKTYQLKTNDASETGVSVTIPEYIEILHDARVSLDFSRWNDMAKNTQLTGIQFRVKHIAYWQGETILGLARETRACATSVNTFFTDVININKAKLAMQSEHLRIAPESSIFSKLITPNLVTTPFYMTMDNENTRIIQAVATTKNNHADRKVGHWSAMQRQLRSLWDQAKLFADKPDNTLNFTLYTYLNSQQEWQIKQEFDFTSAAEKTLFINQALMSPEHYFYHGSLTSLKTKQVSQQQDLYETLLELRAHSQHKVKQIRQVFHTMFAIGEFTDITDIIRAAYR